MQQRGQDQHGLNSSALVTQHCQGLKMRRGRASVLSIQHCHGLKVHEPSEPSGLEDAQRVGLSVEDPALSGLTDPWRNAPQG